MMLKLRNSLSGEWVYVDSHCIKTFVQRQSSIGHIWAKPYGQCL